MLLSDTEISVCAPHVPGLLNRKEFVAFSLPVFMSIEFSAALLLLEAFVQACTVVVASPQEIARNQYDAMRRELADSVTRSLTRYAHDPHIQKTINKEFKDEDNYRYCCVFYYVRRLVLFSFRIVIVA